MKSEIRVAQGQEGFAYDRDLNRTDEATEIDGGEVNTTIEDVITTPIGTLEEILAYEPDPFKRLELEEYANKLSEEAKLDLLDAMRTFHGGPAEITDIMSSVKSLCEEAAQSKMVYLRNAAFATKTVEFTRLSQQVSRMLNGPKKDDPFNSLLSDNLSKYTTTLHEQIATLAGAIYHMSGKLGYETPSDPYSLPIDLENLVKLTVVIGSGVRTWAATSVTSKKAITELEKLLSQAQAKINILEAVVEENRLERLRLAEEKEKSRVRSSEGYYIMNHTGWFIGCSVPPEEGSEWRLSPSNVFLTVDMDKALDLASLDDARLLLDSVKIWQAKHYNTNRMFKKTGVNVDTLFIGQFNINRVEG